MAKDPLKTVGASNLSDKERAKNDYYATDPKTTKAFLATYPLDKTKLIWDPGSGHNLIINVLQEYGYKTWSTDLYNYGYQDNIFDFLTYSKKFEGIIFGNPPYKLANEFVKHALEIVTPGSQVIFLLRTLFLEGQKRYNDIFKQKNLKFVFVFINRQVCSTKDDFTEGSAISYSFFVFEKGFIGEPTIKWLATN